MSAFLRRTFRNAGNRISRIAQQAAGSVTTLEGELAGLKKSVDAHPVDQRLLEMEGEILELFGSRGAYLKNQKDLPSLGHKRHNLREEAQRLLKKLGVSDDLDEVENLRLSDPKRRQISAAAEELKSIRQQLVTASNNVEARKAEVEELMQKIELMPAVRSTFQETITRLNQRLTATQANLATITHLRNQIEEKEKQLSLTRSRVAALQEDLRQLLQEARVEVESDFQLVTSLAAPGKDGPQE